MNQIELILAARASAEGRAIRRAEVRHRHLSKHLFAIAAFQPAAEPFSALAVAYGRTQAKCGMLFVVEPRNRTLLFEAMTPMAKEFNGWFEAFAASRESHKWYENGVASDGPQVAVPNGATAMLLGRWGRRLAYLQTSGAWAADPALIEFGKHLQFLADHAEVPGQSLVIPATTLLRRHWVTGQSDLEDENLAA